MIFIHGELPERAEDVRDGDKSGGAYGVQTGFEVRQRPALPDDVAVEGVAVVDAETWTPIFLRDDRDRTSPGAGTFFDYAPLEHVMYTFVNDAGGTRVGAVRGPVYGSGISGEWKGCFRSGTAA